MHVAAMTGQTKVFQTMLQKAVDKNPKDDNWDTPLHSAAKGGHYTICKLIIDAGIGDKNPSNINGETPLHSAAEGGHYTICKLIIDSGIRDKNPKSKSDETPLELATVNNHGEVCLLILESVGSVVLWWKNGFLSYKSDLLKQRKRRHTD